MTALFDLARREGNPARRPADDYLQRGQFLFGLDEDVVFFADPELADHIGDRRREHGLGDRTLVMSSALEELLSHDLPDRIEQAHRRRPILNGDPAKDTALYVALGWSKFRLVELAIQLDPFGTTHFAWIDFGLYGGLPAHHAADQPFARPSDRVRLLMLKPFSREEIGDSAYYSWLRGHLGAGYVSGSRASMLRLNELMAAEAESALASGFGPTEEQLLPVVAAEHPDLFEFHYGDYSHVLENYVRLRGSATNLLFQMRHCRAVGDFDRALDIVWRLLAGYQDGTFACGADQLAELLDECFIAAYHAEYPEQHLAHEIAGLYAGLVIRDPDARDVFLRHEIRLRSNFALLSDEAEAIPRRLLRSPPRSQRKFALCD